MTLPEPNEGPEVAQLRVQLSNALGDSVALGEAIGCGRCGVVFRARNLATKRDIALKVAWDDPLARAQLARETSLTSEVVHPNVLPTQKLYLGKPIFVVEMPLATGGTLDRLFDRLSFTPVPFPHVLGIVRQVAGALEEAHKKGIVHGSLCPEKILLDENGQCLLPDFGLRIPARFDPVAALPSELAFPAYAPMEQRHDGANVDGRVDEYALAVLAYELLRGRRTWRVGPDGVLEVDPLEIPLNRPIAAGVPLSASAAIRRATSRDPGHRFLNIGDFARAFAGQTTVVVTPGKPRRRPVFRNQRRAWMAVPVVLVLGLLASLPSVRDAVGGLWPGRQNAGELEGSPLPPSLESNATGVIKVTVSGGTSAFVVIDGQTRGGTPLSWQASPGRHVVSLRGENRYVPSAVNVDVVAGDTSRAMFVAR